MTRQQQWRDIVSSFGYIATVRPFVRVAAFARTPFPAS